MGHRERIGALLLLVALVGGCLQPSGTSGRELAVEQPTGGPGWRLLGTPEGDRDDVVGVAINPADAASVWTDLRLAGRAPEVDYGREILVILVPPVGWSCPVIRLDDVPVDVQRRIVFGRYTYPSELPRAQGASPRPCPADAQPQPFVVAVDRGRLPAVPFAVRLLESAQLCGGCAPTPEVRIRDATTAFPLASPDRFDEEPYPEGFWFQDGVAWPREAAYLFIGPKHCEWQSANFLHLGWPLGHRATTSSAARQYIRDPLGVLGHALLVPYDGAVTLPPDARFTGLRNGDLELWISDAQVDQSVYVVTGNGAERWPRAEMIGCA